MQFPMLLFSLQSNQYRFNFNAFHYRQAQYLTNQWLFKHLCNFYITCLSLFPLISFSGVEWILLYENMKPALNVWFTKFTAEQITVVDGCVFEWHRFPVYSVYKDTFVIPADVVPAGEWLIINRKVHGGNISWSKIWGTVPAPGIQNQAPLQLKSQPVNTLHNLHWYTLKTEITHFSQTSVTLPIDTASYAKILAYSATPLW